MISKLLKYAGSTVIGMGIGYIANNGTQGTVTIEFSQERAQEELYNIRIWENFNWEDPQIEINIKKQIDIVKMFPKYYKHLAHYKSMIKEALNEAEQDEKISIEVSHTIDLIRMRSIIHGPLHSNLSEDEYEKIVGGTVRS
jgi:hypothetical protein